MCDDVHDGVCDVMCDVVCVDCLNSKDVMVLNNRMTLISHKGKNPLFITLKND